MSYTISTLLARNLHDVFGENDPERRRPAIDELYTEDVVFYDPSKGVYRGREPSDRSLHNGLVSKDRPAPMMAGQTSRRQQP